MRTQMNLLRKISVIITAGIFSLSTQALADTETILDCGSVELQVANPGHYAFGIAIPVFYVLDKSDSKTYAPEIKLHSEGGTILLENYQSNKKLKIYVDFMRTYVLAIDGIKISDCVEK